MASILVVDDMKNVRDWLKTKLRDEGFEVTTTIDGQGALDQAETGTHDVALVDCQMPFGGRDLYIELKERFSDLLLIAMTDLGSKAEIEKGLVPPADGAWHKPTNPGKKASAREITECAREITVGELAIKVLVELIHTLLEKKAGLSPSDRGGRFRGL